MTPTPTLPLQISFDRYAMVINGQRTFIRSAAMHYFRLPGEDMWRDRLYKIKAAGYNTIDLYFCWAYHSPAPGVYDFTGIRDVKKLLQIAAEMGFYLIARPGPYINAEYTAGGLPGWLVADKSVILRNRNQSGDHVWSEPYMKAVTEWWDQIVPQFRDYPYLLMVQIENEYATSDMEPDYMQALYQMTRDRGITVPLMHNDMYASGLFEDVVDIYAFDNYSVTSFETDWRDSEGVFGVLDNVEESMRPYCQNRPLMVAELQAGWFGGWKGYPYETIVEQLGREHISLATRSLIAQGLTIFNHYKGVGGTNWGYIGSTDTYTSYDFGAPISESGVNTDRLFETKALNTFLSSFNLSATDRSPEYPFTLTAEPDVLYAVRHPVTENEQDSHWLFLRNTTPHTVNGRLEDASLTEAHPVHLAPFSFKILPYNIPLQCGYLLRFSAVEPLYQTESILVLKGEDSLTFEIETPQKLPVSKKSEHVTCDDAEPGHYAVKAHLKDPKDVEYLKIGELTIYILGSFWVDRHWREEDGTLVCGPEARLHTGEYAIPLPFDQMLSISPIGQLTWEKQIVSTQEDGSPHILLPTLAHWKSHHEAPQLYSAQGFTPVSPEGADLDSNGYYEGCAWYRYSFDGPLSKDKAPHDLTVFARHIWGIFLNGQFLGEGHHWSTALDTIVMAPQKVFFPEELISSEAPNDICLFVDGLGHPKGFHDDAQEPQGLLTLKLDDRDITQDVSIYPGIAHWHAPFREAFGLLPETSPLVRLETTFTLPVMEDVVCPLGLKLKNLPYERINIILNGILIGRYWQACQRQDLFYMPEDLLVQNQEGENKLELLLMNFSPLISVAGCIPAKDDVQIVPYQELSRITR